jgi:hypothetical protein
MGRGKKEPRKKRKTRNKIKSGGKQRQGNKGGGIGTNEKRGKEKK